jgi:glycosyltransferase involved in cell wall biosynthesis
MLFNFFANRYFFIIRDINIFYFIKSLITLYKNNRKIFFYMENPVVSVILPTYNRCNLLQKAIDSVYDQSFTDWEIIVIDSQSTDGTNFFMSKLVKKDDRIKYFDIPKKKTFIISEYLNFGIEISRGKYLARLDDDDVWCDRDKLKEQVEFLDSNPEYVLVGGGSILVDANDNEMNRYIKKETDSKIRKYALLACPFDHTTIMIRKSTLDTIGGYKNVQAEDWEFFLRLGTAGKFHNIQKYYVRYLQDGKGISNKTETETALSELRVHKIYRKYYPNYYIGFILTSMQLLYTYLPFFIRKKLHYSIRFIKRKYF